MNTQATWRSVKSPSVTTTAVAAALYFGVVGTGGTLTSENLSTFRTSSGGNVVVLQRRSAERGITTLLETVRATLRLSVAELAILFKVSRQTIYNWQKDHPCEETYARRIRALAGALEPHVQLLRSQSGRTSLRALDGQQTVLEMLRDNRDVEATIGSLVALLERDVTQRARLERQMRGKSGDRGAADIDALG